MSTPDFDQIVRFLTALPTRRTFVRAALGIGSLLAAGQLPNGTDAGKHRRKRKKNKKKKVTLNEFGCVDVGSFCQGSDQCCSGICQGKKDKKRCQAHDESTCQPGEDVCLAVNVECLTTAGTEGFCMTTTGQASYCQAAGDCFPCEKDADCVPFCGAEAACVVCATCEFERLQTGCVGLSECTFPDL